jgi:hypothetical protein
MRAAAIISGVEPSRFAAACVLRRKTSALTNKLQGVSYKKVLSFLKRNLQ